jgi:hypothetical protein
MVARAAAASKNRKKSKKPEKSKESPPPLCATVQIREFLGAAVFWWIWIPNYSFLEKPLYKTTKGGEQEPMV